MDIWTAPSDRDWYEYVGTRSDEKREEDGDRNQKGIYEDLCDGICPHGCTLDEYCPTCCESDLR